MVIILDSETSETHSTGSHGFSDQQRDQLASSDILPDFASRHTSVSTVSSTPNDQFTWQTAHVKLLSRCLSLLNFARKGTSLCSLVRGRAGGKKTAGERLRAVRGDQGVGKQAQRRGSSRLMHLPVNTRDSRIFAMVSRGCAGCCLSEISWLPIPYCPSLDIHLTLHQ